jgi:hypothetical protein
MADPISAGLDVIAAAANLVAKIQDEKNTPEMIKAAKEEAKLEWDAKRDSLEAILSNPKETRERKRAAFNILQVIDS